jgi:hypothetical protein
MPICWHAIRNEKQLSSSSEAQLKAASEKFVSVFA